MFLFILLHLSITLAFGALLVVNCGKKKNEEEEIKESIEKNGILAKLKKEAKERCEREDLKCKPREREAEPKKTWQEIVKIQKEERKKKRDQQYKEGLGKKCSDTDRVWRICQDYIETCNYFEQYSSCDLAYRLRIAYNNIRYWCHARGSSWEGTNVKYWCLYTEDIGTRLYMPYFRELKKNFHEKHGEHLDQKGIEEILDVFKQIEKDFELVIEGKKKYEKVEPGKQIDDKYSKISFKNLEPWMKPSWFDEYYGAQLSDLFSPIITESAWKGRNDIDEMIKTCRKNIHGGQCDFIGRANFYIAQWRNHAQRDAPFSKKGMYEDEELEVEYSATYEDIIKYKIEICDIYMKKVDEAKDKHREHLKNPKELDDWFQLHKKKTKELKEKYEACKKGDKDWSKGEWKEFIGFKVLPVCIPLSDDKD